jgi:hypothetical protein
MPNEQGSAACHPNADLDRPVLLTIHGVGDDAPGGAVAGVRQVLAEKYHGLVLAEYHWNQPALRPIDPAGPNLRVDSLAELVQVIGRAAQAGAGILGGPGKLLITALQPVVALALPLVLVAPVFFTLLRLPATPDHLVEIWLHWVACLGFAAFTVIVAPVITLLVLGAISAIRHRSAAPLFIAARGVALPLVTLPIAVAAYPFTQVWAPTSREYLDALVSSLVVFTLTLPLLLVAALIRVMAGQDGLGEILRGLWVIPFYLAVALASGFLALITVAVVGLLVKILLDIFRYVGDPGYRAAIQAGLDDKVRELRGTAEGRTFYLLAHSLGSVIAVDSLVHSVAWRKDDRVYLVTMGSPIRRSFQRFFPDILFPASAADIRATVAARVGSFRWVNVYRPLDYVGASLGLSRAGCGIDRRVRQGWRFHVGYWSDPAVRDAVVEALAAEDRSTPAAAVPERSDPTPILDDEAGVAVWDAQTIRSG